MKTIRPLFLAGSLCLSACTQAPDCNVDQAHIDPVSANAGCLLRQGPALLIVRQRVSGRWNIPAGTSNGETAQCTAHRETWEETGVEVQVGPLLKIFDNDFRLYACQAVNPQLDVTKPLKTPISGMLEISEARWIRPQDIEKKDWRYPDRLQDIQRLFDKVSAD